MKRIIFAGIAALIAYSIPVGGLLASSVYSIYPYLTRNEVQYPPSGTKLVTEDGFVAWYSEGRGSVKRTPIIGFSGNTGRPTDILSKKQSLIRAGHDLLILVYPGSNNTPGDPSEDLIRKQAMNAYDWLYRETGKRPIAYGLSLGTGVAVALAKERKIEALILEMPYTSIYDVARNRYKVIPPFDILPDNRWRSIDRIEDIDVPLLVLHGEKDRLIPVEHAYEIYRASPSYDKFLEVYPEGTHFNLHQFGAEERILNFIEDYAG